MRLLTGLLLAALLTSALDAKAQVVNITNQNCNTNGNSGNCDVESRISFSEMRGAGPFHAGSRYFQTAPYVCEALIGTILEELANTFQLGGSQVEIESVITTMMPRLVPPSELPEADALIFGREVPYCEYLLQQSVDGSPIVGSSSTIQMLPTEGLTRVVLRILDYARINSVSQALSVAQAKARAGDMLTPVILFEEAAQSVRVVYPMVENDQTTIRWKEALSDETVKLVPRTITAHLSVPVVHFKGAGPVQHDNNGQIRKYPLLGTKNVDIAEFNDDPTLLLDPSLPHRPPQDAYYEIKMGSGVRLIGAVNGASYTPDGYPTEISPPPTSNTFPQVSGTRFDADPLSIPFAPSFLNNPGTLSNYVNQNIWPNVDGVSYLDLEWMNVAAAIDTYMKFVARSAITAVATPNDAESARSVPLALSHAVLSTYRTSLPPYSGEALGSCISSTNYEETFDCDVVYNSIDGNKNNVAVPMAYFSQTQRRGFIELPFAVGAQQSGESTGAINRPTTFDTSIIYHELTHLANYQSIGVDIAMLSNGQIAGIRGITEGLADAVAHALASREAATTGLVEWIGQYAYFKPGLWIFTGYIEDRHKKSCSAHGTEHEYIDLADAYSSTLPRPSCAIRPSFDKSISGGECTAGSGEFYRCGTRWASALNRLRADLVDEKLVTLDGYDAWLGMVNRHLMRRAVDLVSDTSSLNEDDLIAMVNELLEQANLLGGYRLREKMRLRLAQVGLRVDALRLALGSQPAPSLFSDAPRYLGRDDSAGAESTTDAQEIPSEVEFSRPIFELLAGSGGRSSTGTGFFANSTPLVMVTRDPKCIRSDDLAKRKAVYKEIADYGATPNAEPIRPLSNGCNAQLIDDSYADAFENETLYVFTSAAKGAYSGIKTGRLHYDEATASFSKSLFFADFPQGLWNAALAAAEEHADKEQVITVPVGYDFRRKTVTNATPFTLYYAAVTRLSGINDPVVSPQELWSESEISVLPSMIFAAPYEFAACGETAGCSQRAAEGSLGAELALVSVCVISLVSMSARRRPRKRHDAREG